MTSVLLSPSWMSTRSYGARSMCEYCLAAATSDGDPGHGVGDLAEQQLGLQRVGQPADAALQQIRRGDRAATSSRNSVVVPAATKIGASSQAPLIAVLLEPVASSSSRSRLLDGRQLGRGRDALDRFLLDVDEQLEQLGRSSSSCASIASLCRMPATRSRSAAVGPDGCGRRVVQLVRQPGGQRAEREQLLALPDDLLRVAHAEEQALEQVDGHGEPRSGWRRRSRRPRRTNSRSR